MVDRQSHASETRGPMPLALHADDAARAIGISPRKLWELTNRRMIPHLRIGRRLLYPIAELQGWLAEQAAKGKGASRD